MVAGWAPTMRGPRATGNRLETTCSTEQSSHFTSKNERLSSCYAISPGWAYTATRAIEAVHSWCFLWMCLYILKIGKNITAELENRRKREWEKLMWKHDNFKNYHCLSRKKPFLETKQTFCDEGASVNSRRRLLQPPRRHPVLPRPFKALRLIDQEHALLFLEVGSRVRDLWSRLNTTRTLSKNDHYCSHPPVEGGQNGDVWYSPHQVKLEKAERKDRVYCEPVWYDRL